MHFNAVYFVKSKVPAIYDILSYIDCQEYIPITLTFMYDISICISQIIQAWQTRGILNVGSCFALLAV